MIKVMINGSRGRMGQAIAACAVESGVHISSQVDAGDDADQFIEIVDVAIDFSHHLATLPLVRTAVAHKKPIVIGTTGHSQADRDAIAELSNEIPMVWAGNFSIGVNLLFHLTSITAKILENGYDAEVLEMHHRLKKDAPSGTAERLLEVIEEAKDSIPMSARMAVRVLPVNAPITKLAFMPFVVATLWASTRCSLREKASASS